MVCIVLLALIAFAVLRSYRVEYPLAAILAILRGAVQLALIGLILHGVITNTGLVLVALLVMFTVASVTSTRRLGWSPRRYAVTAASMLCGIAVALVVIFSTGAVAFTSRYELALGGIIIGNTMTIATLTGRQLNQTIGDHWDEVEGWLALGATPRQATIGMGRLSVHNALVPTTDQTKTTGLVTLPGAFVGAIFGGLSPVEAGRFQIVVLASIMCAGAITSVIAAWALAPQKVLNPS